MSAKSTVGDYFKFFFINLSNEIIKLRHKLVQQCKERNLEIKKEINSTVTPICYFDSFIFESTSMKMDGIVKLSIYTVRFFFA